MHPVTEALRAASVALVVVGLAALSACDQGGLSGAKAEVGPPNVNLDLPAIPEFKMPPLHADGSHTVRGLQLKGRKLFGTELKVKGYVLWIYDCLTHRRKPDQSDRQAKKMIDKDPSLCYRPHFVLGDSADTPSDKGIWIVEVPRKLRKDEKKLYTKEELKNLPPVPVIEVGDEVTVTGTWDRESPKGFTQSNGLLVYGSLETLSEDE